MQNTFILKRKWPPPLHKKGGKPSKLRARHFVYDLVEDTNVTKQPDVKVILSQFVDGKPNRLFSTVNACLAFLQPLKRNTTVEIKFCLI